VAWQYGARVVAEMTFYFSYTSSSSLAEKSGEITLEEQEQWYGFMN